MKLNLDFTGATLLKEWWQTVKANFEAIQLHSTEAVIDHPDKSVTSEKIADYAVKTMKIANESVSAGKIATDAVRTMHLKDGNVTMAKLHSDVQTQLNNFQEHINNPSQEIADYSVTREKLSYDINSDFERTVNTADFINVLYGCRAFPWTKNELILINHSFPTEYRAEDTTQVVDEDFTEDIWYLFHHDGTFEMSFLEYIANGGDDLYHFDFTQGVVNEGMYALKFHTNTLADDQSKLNTGKCQVKLLSNGDFESMINGGSSITVDSELSSASENPVQNKVVNEALNKKMDWECNYGDFNNMDEALTAILDLQDRVSALEG